MEDRREKSQPSRIRESENLKFEQHDGNVYYEDGDATFSNYSLPGGIRNAENVKPTKDGDQVNNEVTDTRKSHQGEKETKDKDGHVHSSKEETRKINPLAVSDRLNKAVTEKGADMGKRAFVIDDDLPFFLKRAGKKYPTTGGDRVARGGASLSHENRAGAYVKHTSYEKINIVELEKLYEKQLNEAWEKDRKTFKESVTKGKVYSLGIDEARKEGYSQGFLSEFGVTINISKRGDLIPKTDLTKTRLFALVHRLIHKKYQEENDSEERLSYNVSALVLKVKFTENCCLTPYKFLLGTGFQHQHDLVVKDDSDVQGKLTFIIGCLVLDWLAGRSVKSHRNSIVKKYGTFQDYALSADGRTGETVAAGARGLGDRRLAFLQGGLAKSMFRVNLENVTFNMKNTLSSERISRIMKSIHKELCRAKYTESGAEKTSDH